MQRFEVGYTVISIDYFQTTSDRQIYNVAIDFQQPCYTYGANAQERTVKSEAGST